jgi:hypothetical protein
MTDRDAIGSKLGCRAFQEGVSDPAGRVFNRQLLIPRMSLDIGRFDNDPKPVALGECPAELLIASGSWAKAMIQMRDTTQRELAVFGEVCKQ